MPEEEITQNASKQEVQQPVVTSNIEEKREEEVEEEKVSIATVETVADEKPKEEEILVETLKPDADVGTVEGEPEDVKAVEEKSNAPEEEVELSVKPTDEEPTMGEDKDQEANVFAQGADGKLIEGEIAEEGDGKGKDEDEGEGEDGGEGEDEGEGIQEGDIREKVEGEGEDAEEDEIKGKSEDQGEEAEEVTETHADKEEAPETQMPLATRSPRASTSIDVDRLLFDAGFKISMTSGFSEDVKKFERGLGGLASEQEEEEKISSASEETAPEEVETQPIDRQPYLEIHANLLRQRPFLKMKNNFLQRKMAEYFKRRKMEHVLRESDRVGDAEAKYLKKLDAFWELRNVNDLQREAITHELNEMRETRNDQLDSVAKNFEQMLVRERETGSGLIYTKTAKEIPEKFLERLLKNQRLKSKEIEEMRLAYIRIRDAVNEVQAKIKALDRIGENHTLIDYEQLKMENQNHSDKIEERDEELGRLRLKYSAAIQCLAHFREKSTNTDVEIEETQDKFEEIETDRNSWREKVNLLNQERDALRTEILKLRESSGLLAKPKLLLDLQDSMATVEEGKRELEEMKEQFEKNAVVLKALKKNMNEEKDKIHLGRPAVKGRKKLGRRKFGLSHPNLERFNVTQFEEASNANK